MNIFIDTLSRWSGGYKRHLEGILKPGNIPDDINIVIYGTYKLFNELPLLDKRVRMVTDDNMPTNPLLLLAWRQIRIPQLIKKYKADVHFSTSGYLNYYESSVIKITMMRNIEPFLSSIKISQCLTSSYKARLFFLRNYLKRSMERADGVIFLSDYSKEILLNSGAKIKKYRIIPHGINECFFRYPTIKMFSNEINVLYVSDINLYKNQWNVAHAINILRNELKFNLNLYLVGRCTPKGRKVMDLALGQMGYPDWIKILGSMSYPNISTLYHKADLFVFASGAETISNIFLEAMASGLPIAYSKRRPMLDILGDDGVPFEPNDPRSIASAIRQLIENHELRHKCAHGAYQRSLAYRWEITSRNTYQFIRDIFNDKSK